MPAVGGHTCFVYDSLGECSADALKRHLDVVANQVAFEPEDAVAHANELGITTSVCCTTNAMIATIDLNYEVRAWRKEINNERADWHLAPKPYAELATTNVQPEELLF